MDEGVAPHPHPPGRERLQVEDPAAQRTVGGPDPPVVLEHVDAEALGCGDHALGDREAVRVGGEVVLGQREVVVRAVGRDPGGDARLDRHRVVAHAARDQVEREGLHDRVERRATADRVAAQAGEQVDQRLLAPPVAVVGLQQVEQHVAQGVDAGRDQVGAEPALLVDRQRDVAVVLDQHHLVDHRHPSRGRHQGRHGHRLPLRTVVRRGHLGQERAPDQLAAERQVDRRAGWRGAEVATGPQRPPAAGDQVDRLGQPGHQPGQPVGRDLVIGRGERHQVRGHPGQHVGQRGPLRHHDRVGDHVEGRAHRGDARVGRAGPLGREHQHRDPGVGAEPVAHPAAQGPAHAARREPRVHERPRTTRIRGRVSSSAGSRGARVSRP